MQWDNTVVNTDHWTVTKWPYGDETLWQNALIISLTETTLVDTAHVYLCTTQVRSTVNSYFLLFKLDQTEIKNWNALQYRKLCRIQLLFCTCLLNMGETSTLYQTPKYLNPSTSFFMDIKRPKVNMCISRGVFVICGTTICFY